MGLPLKQSTPSATIADIFTLSAPTCVSPGGTFSASFSVTDLSGTSEAFSQPLPAWRLTGPGVGLVYISGPVGDYGPPLEEPPPTVVVEAYQSWPDGFGHYITDVGGWNVTLTPSGLSVSEGLVSGTVTLQVQVPSFAPIGVYSVCCQASYSSGSLNYLLQAQCFFTVWAQIGLTVTGNHAGGNADIGSMWTVDATFDGAGTLLATPVDIFLDDVGVDGLDVIIGGGRGPEQAYWGEGSSPVLTLTVPAGSASASGSVTAGTLFSSLTFGDAAADSPPSTLPASVGTGTLRAMSIYGSNTPTAAISAQNSTIAAPAGNAGYQDITSRQLVAALGMATGGGAAHVHLAIAKQRNLALPNGQTPGPGDPPFSLASWPVTVCSSDNGGKTFGPGVDVGAAMWEGTLCGTVTDQTLSPDNAGRGSAAITTFVALPGGELYLNGIKGGAFQTEPGGTSGPRQWQTARVCQNPSSKVGAPVVWQAATTPNQQPDTLISGQPANLGTENPVNQWGTQAAHPSAHGAGVKTGGAWQLRSVSLSWIGSQTVPAWNNPPELLSMDGGNTWQPDAAFTPGTNPSGSTGNGVMLGQMQYDGQIISSDGFRMTGNYLPLGTPFGGSSGGALGVGGDGEACVGMLYLGSNSLAGPSTIPSSEMGGYNDFFRTVILGIAPQTDTLPTSLTILSSLQPVYSTTGDGNNLAAIFDPSKLVHGQELPVSGMALWQSGGTICLACYPNFAPEQLSVFLSNNKGAWYTLACYSLDDGATWIQPKVGQS